MTQDFRDRAVSSAGAMAGSGPVTVLMYHAVLEGGAPDPDCDAHYAVSRAQFRRHVEAVCNAAARPASVLSLWCGASAQRSVGFTFDDGHASNAWAAECLAQAGGSGDFFVNTSTVGTSGFLSWGALREMAAAGMSIQSHGHQHRYLDELTPAEVDDELRRSKEIIEDRLGQPVALFAPPGGRVSENFQLTAAGVGYKAVCSSKVGLWRDTGIAEVPRFAVLARTGDHQLGRWIRQDRRELMTLQLRAGMLNAGKRLLGNQGYERLRARLLRPHAAVR